MDVREKAASALHSFREGKSEVDEFSGGSSAADLLALHRSGHVPRYGRTASGLPYFIHGSGYTLTLSNGGEVHLDASGDGRDCFKVCEIIQYMDSAEMDRIPSVSEVQEALDEHVLCGSLDRLARSAYAINPAQGSERTKPPRGGAR